MVFACGVLVLVLAFKAVCMGGDSPLMSSEIPCRGCRFEFDGSVVVGRYCLWCCRAYRVWASSGEWDGVLR